MSFRVVERRLSSQPLGQLRFNRRFLPAFSGARTYATSPTDNTDPGPRSSSRQSQSINRTRSTERGAPSPDTGAPAQSNPTGEVKREGETGAVAGGSSSSEERTHGDQTIKQDPSKPAGEKARQTESQRDAPLGPEDK
ncbi:MAG: hypothetical protein M4579_001661 [Chaenotheca gracillima]|nr:MAG: hypothetical protein M4579_001661 [Chaenotheca gracillima]